MANLIDENGFPLSPNGSFADNNVEPEIDEVEEVTDPSYEIDFTKRSYDETFNLNAAMTLISNPRLITDKSNEKVLQIISQLKKYVKASSDGVIKIKYKYGADCENTGRVYCTPWGMQSMPKRIRYTLANNLYHDVDMVNAHPCILSQLCVKYGFKCDVLMEYINNRDTILSNIETEYDVKRSKSKNLFIRLLNGGSFQEWSKENHIRNGPNDYITNFINELISIQENFYSKYTKLQTKALKKRPNPKASLLARVLGNEENRILQAMVSFVEKRFHYQVKVLVFDGFQILRKSNESLTKTMLDTIARFVKDALNFDIQLIEKYMDDPYILPLLTQTTIENPKMKTAHHLTITDEMQAAKVLVELHEPEHIKNCEGTLYVYDPSSGIWNTEEHIIHNIMLKYAFEMGDWVKTISKWKRIYAMMKVILEDDRTFLQKVELSTMGKILFKNGIYDFEKFSFSFVFDPNLFFLFRIERDYNPNPDQTDIDYVDRVLFQEPFGDINTGLFMKERLSRAIAGTGLRDKSLTTLIGLPDSGKGVLTDAILACFEKYAKSFDGNILQNQSNKEAALQHKVFLSHRYRRILLSNELSPDIPLSGTMIQKYTSGGDTQEGRGLFKDEVSFIPQFTLFLYANDRPQIIGLNETETGRVCTVNYPFTYTTNTIVDPNSNKRQADPSIKDKFRDLKLKDALFHILAKAYVPHKPIAPDSVKISTSEWNSNDDFLTLFQKYFEVTGNLNDKVLNSDIMLWAKEKGLQVSANKIWLLLKTFPKISNPKERIRCYYGVKVYKDLLIVNDSEIDPAPVAPPISQPKITTSFQDFDDFTFTKNKIKKI